MKKSIIGTLLMYTVFTACQDDPIVTALQEKGIDVDQVSDIVSRSGSDKSPEELLHELQTDQVAMLISAIELKDSVYVLTLTAEDVTTLGIPDSTYQKVLNVVKSYNANLNK